MMSQANNALSTLKEQILNGKLEPGERLLELALVERLGVSRTPIRTALTRLAEEGLLEEMNGGGYAVRQFTVRDIEDAIEARGSLEGMAVRLTAERGANPQALSTIKECLAQFDRLLEKTELDNADIKRYFDLNDVYHNQLVALTESFVIEQALRRITAIPFASANAFVMAQANLGRPWHVFFVAQEQHKGIIEAIENREGARAEALAREHARLSLSTLKAALKTRAALEQIPGLKLIYVPD
ncbi:MAG TPA: GntR family transcriptional regulator [Chloroflexota bacterium]|nr:GntR family transcriptional regulator [Chloroflexota bacterium]